MAINPNILLGVQPTQIPQPDPNAGMNALARALQIKGLQQEQQANALKMERQNKMAELLGATYAKPEEREEALLRGGFVKESADLTKNRVDAEKVKVDTDKNRVEAAHKRVDAWGQIMGFVRQNPTAENATAAVQHLVTMGVLTPELGQQALGGLSTNPTPQAIAQFADMGFRAALGVKEQLAKFQTNNIGGQTITQGIDPVTGKATLVSAVQNTQSPDNIATNARVAADNALSRQVTMRGQDMTDQRQRDQNNIQSGQKTQQGVMDLRKEFNALPDVKKFREVLPVIQSVQRAPDTPAGDIDLIYGVGKVMDPESVVREGEMTLVIKSGSPAQRVAGYYNYVKGGGRLTQAQRQELVTVLNSRVEGLKSNYDAARKTYETAADRVGLPKDQIFIENDMPPPMPVDFGALPSAGKPQAGRGNAPTKPRELQWGK